MVMRIKERRKAIGMKQVELADAMGTSQSTVTGWETETYLPRARDLPRLAQVLKCGIGDLFQAEPEEAC